MVDAPGPRNGDVVLYSENNRTRLSSAVLGTLITQISEDIFLRYIKDTDEVRHPELGHMVVERTVPDPDATFKSLGRDPLLANVPEGIRSAVDPLPYYHHPMRALV